MIRHLVLPLWVITACVVSPCLAAELPSSSPSDSTRSAPTSSSSPSDSTRSAPTSSSSPSDSTLTIMPDSSTTAPENAILQDPGPLLPPWTMKASLGPGELKGLRPRGADDIVEAIGGSSLRVAGDRGFDAYLDLSPIDGGSVEILCDGIPTRSPADLDPGIWDVSATGLSTAGESQLGASSVMGGSAVRLERDPAVWGQTLFRTHFQKSRLETYLRGLSVTTPRAPRTVRLDYEEWKTELGYDINGLSGPASSSAYGKAKMRRWVLSSAVNTELGRWSVGFGRGRRYHNGTVRSSGSVERWTGQLWTGLDRQSDTRHLRIRLYHLDWNDDDFIHAEKRDALRMGSSLSSIPRGAGPIVHADVERWSAVFHSNSLRSEAKSLVGRARLGWQSDPGEALSFRGEGEVVYGEHVATPWAGGGEVEGKWRPGSKWWVSLGGGRKQRTPTLLESSGFQSFDFLGGFTLRRLSQGDLPFERHDRVRAEWGMPLGKGRVVLGLGRWWLRDGIGWVPDSYSATDGNAHTVGGLSYELDQFDWRLRWPMGNIHHGVEWTLNGHTVIGDLPRDGSRGSGWPKDRVYFTVRWWHDLLSSYDQIRLFYRVAYTGAHYDDLLGVFNDEGEFVSSGTRQDVRLALKLRDAEVYLEVHNLFDTVIEEVAGTHRRGRDLEWGLAWPFWN